MSIEPIQPYLEPIRRTLSVPRSPAEAFAVFTEGLGRWWPLAQYSISQARARTCVIEPRVGGMVYEVSDEGTRHVWGTVLDWEPPRRFVMTWHPGREPETAQEVEVRFVRDGEGTRVELEHRGWQMLGTAAAETREGYDQGWNTVLALYVKASQG